MSIRDVLRQVARKIGETGGNFPPFPWLELTSAETLAELPPNTHHAVISVWNLDLPDERALADLPVANTINALKVKRKL